MTTYPHPDRMHLHRPHVSPWLVASVGLAAALIALAAWVLVDHYAGGSSETEKAAALIDRFNGAVNRNDAAAIAAALTSDAVFYQRNYNAVTGANTIGKVIATSAGTKNLKRIAPVALNGDYATTFIHFSAMGGVEDWPQLQVYQLKNGKIARIWGFILGQTPPFENVARS